jgi:hypothetical protein
MNLEKKKQFFMNNGTGLKEAKENFEVNKGTCLQ